MYNVLLFLHIVGAGIWLGGNVTQFVLTPRFRREPASRGTYLRGTVDMGTRLYTPAAILILLTGIGMVVSSDTFGFADAFVSIGFLMVIVGGVLGGVVFGPLGRRSAELQDAGDQQGATAVEARLGRWGLVDTALLLVTIAAMVWRWGA